MSAKVNDLRTNLNFTIKQNPLSRDKVNLDIFWLRDESLEDSAKLPSPDVIAAEIVEDLRAALAQFEELLGGR